MRLRLALALTAALALAAPVAADATKRAPTVEPQSYTLRVHDAYGNNDGDGSWAYCGWCFGQPAVYAESPSYASAVIQRLVQGDEITLTHSSWGTWRVCWHTGMSNRDSDCGGVPEGHLTTFLLDGSRHEVWLAPPRAGLPAGSRVR